MLRIKCPNCRQPVQIGLAQAGARTCPACGAAIDKLQLDEHVVRPDPPESGTKHRSASADQLVMAGAPNALDARIQAGDPAGQTPLADPEAGECFDAKPY